MNSIRNPKSQLITRDGWENWKLAHAFLLISSGTTPPTSNVEYFQGEIPWVNTGDLNDGYIDNVSNYVSKKAVNDFSALKIYPKDSLIIALYGATIGKLGIITMDACTNQACCVLAKPLHLDSKFVFYWFISERSNIIELARGGGQPNISQEIVKQLRVLAPSIEQQKAIASFLDRKTAAIATIINKKQRLIQLLEEKRKVLINQTVTKGLNPNAPMKDSGIPWIGKIPEHWLKMPIKRVCSSVRDGTHNPPPRVEIGKYRLLSARNIQVGKFILRDDDRLMSADAFRELERSYTVRKGDVVIAIVGATTGKSAVVGDIEKVSVQRSIAILRPRHTIISSNYLNFLITSSSLQNEIALISSKYAAQGGIYLEDLANLTCVLPPSLKEQSEILDFLGKAFTSIIKAEKKLFEQIEKLQEYRQSLITESVTGKINVIKEIKA